MPTAQTKHAVLQRNIFLIFLGQDLTLRVLRWITLKLKSPRLILTEVINSPASMGYFWEQLWGCCCSLTLAWYWHLGMPGLCFVCWQSPARSASKPGWCCGSCAAVPAALPLGSFPLTGGAVALLWNIHVKETKFTESNLRLPQGKVMGRTETSGISSLVKQLVEGSKL